MPYTVCQYRLGTVPVPSRRYLQSTGKCLLARYLLDTGTPIHPHVTGKYLLAWYRFAISIPVPTSYRQISSGPVPFCPQHTDTNIVPANIFWPSAILPLAYRYRHLTGKYHLAQYHFAISVPVPALYRQISSGPVPFCPQCTSTNILPELSIGPVQICFQHTGNNILHARLGIGWARQQKFVTQEYLMTSLAKRVISLTKLEQHYSKSYECKFYEGVLDGTMKSW